MDTTLFVLLFLASCGAGIVVSLMVRPAYQYIVLAGLGSLAGGAAVAAGAEVLLAGETFTRLLWSVPGLGTLTLHLDSLSAAFVLASGLVLIPAANCGANSLALKRGPSRCCCLRSMPPSFWS